LVIKIKRSENEALNKLLRTSNRSLAVFGQPPLYETTATSPQQVTGEKHAGRTYKQVEKPAVTGDSASVDYSHCFHVSIAWSLKEPSTEDKQKVADMDLRSLSALRIKFSSVKFKIGNVVTSKAFPVRNEDSIGFAGV
jgi:hypothetical protein